ncbi:MAG: tRNA(Met) cytidine acetyltransferase [Gammaproteobacteria bacterium]|nr:tRNA(Met) cytidine acetyltransferase [Gammaproteobacteria bacterium]
MDKEAILNYTKKLTELARHAVKCRHRYMVVIEGDYQWADGICKAFLSDEDRKDTLLVSEKIANGFINTSNEKVESFLGQEFSYIIYDAYSGFSPNSVCLSEGLLKGGGLFFFIRPSIDTWLTSTDKFHEQYTMHPYSGNDMDHLFISRFDRLLTENITVSKIIQAGESRFYKPTDENNSFANTEKSGYSSESQKNAVEKICHVVTGHRNRPLVVLANRGHGKSAALGIACAQLIKHDQVQKVIITAPRRSATDILFKHVRLLLPDKQELNDHRIEFIAPDELLINHRDCNLLLIDEASSIPSPILERLLSNYKRIVFSTTVYGYEGNGRGFELKFLNKMKKMIPGSSVIRIDDPVRWNKGDPLEHFFYDAFLLKSTEATEIVTSIDRNQLKLVKIDRNDLVKDESLLKSLYGLLLNAHYKTTPNDLRVMMDCPYISVYGLKYAKEVIAVSLIVEEGGLDAEISQSVYEGSRRLKGHHLPQTLINEFGDTNNGELRYARIIRIAVAPGLQNHGIGTLLLQYLHVALRKSYDVIGAVFGCDIRLFEFWHKNNFSLVKLGHKRNAFSGYYSAVMLKALSDKAENLIPAIEQKYFDQFLFSLTDNLKSLDSYLVVKILCSYSTLITVELSSKDLGDLKSFATTNRQFNSCSVALYKLYLVSVSAGTIDVLEARNLQLLTQRLMQRLNEDMVVKANKLKGKKDLLKLMRESVAILLK